MRAKTCLGNYCRLHDQQTSDFGWSFLLAPSALPQGWSDWQGYPCLREDPAESRQCWPLWGCWGFGSAAPLPFQHPLGLSISPPDLQSPSRWEMCLSCLVGLRVSQRVVQWGTQEHSLLSSTNPLSNLCPRVHWVLLLRACEEVRSAINTLETLFRELLFWCCDCHGHEPYWVWNCRKVIKTGVEIFHPLQRVPPTLGEE